MGFFPLDDVAMEYFRTCGRTADEISACTACSQAQGLFGTPREGGIDVLAHS